MSLSNLRQQMPALNQAGELILLKNTPGKTSAGSARQQRQGHANAWVSTRWRRGCAGEAACPPAPGQEAGPKPAELARSCAVSARQKAVAPGTVTSKPHHASLRSLKTPCQQVCGAGVKQLPRPLFACAKTASAHTSHPTHTLHTHNTLPMYAWVPACNLHV